MSAIIAFAFLAEPIPIHLLDWHSLPLLNKLVHEVAESHLWSERYTELCPVAEADYHVQITVGGLDLPSRSMLVEFGDLLARSRVIPVTCWVELHHKGRDILMIVAGPELQRCHRSLD